MWGTWNRLGAGGRGRELGGRGGGTGADLAVQHAGVHQLRGTNMSQWAVLATRAGPWLYGWLS